MQILAFDYFRNSIKNNNNMSSFSFKEGDRVVLQNIQQQHSTASVPATATTMNGRHGRVARVFPQAYAIHLDTTMKTLMVKPHHVTRERSAEREEGASSSTNAVASDISVDEAPAINDCGFQHTKEVSDAIVWLLQYIRWVVATKVAQIGEISLEQVPPLPPDKSQALNQYAFQHWNSTVYKAVLDQLQLHADDEGSSSCNTNTASRSSATTATTTRHIIVKQALQSKAAALSWHLGLSGDFWLVGQDAWGMYVVPDCNKELVYKIVAIQQQQRQGKSSAAILQQDAFAAAPKQQQQPLSLHKIPTRLPLCIVPWYGKLLYDSTLTPRQGDVGKATDAALAHQLQTTVLQTIQAGRVLDSFAELSVDSKTYTS
jgi:ribosomal protein L21E